MSRKDLYFLQVFVWPVSALLLISVVFSSPSLFIKSVLAQDVVVETSSTSDPLDNVENKNTSLSLKVIPAIFHIEEGINNPDEVAQALVDVANEYLEEVGFTIKKVRAESMPGILEQSMYDVLKNLIDISRLSPQDEPAIRLAITQGIKGDRRFGLSYPGSLCQAGKSVAAVAFLGSSSDAIYAAGKTLAHEVGHMLGAEHDDNMYQGAQGELFSLMYSKAVPLTSGFSELSRQQILAYAGPTQFGSSCLSIIDVSSPGNLEIIGPERIEVETSQVSTVKLLVTPGGFLKLEGSLPEEISYNAATRELLLNPAPSLIASSASSVEFIASFSTKNLQTKATKNIVIAVKNSNPAPVFSDGNMTKLSFKSKARFMYSFSTRTSNNSPVNIRCTGKPSTLRQIRRGNTVSFLGNITRSAHLRCSAKSVIAPQVAVKHIMLDVVKTRPARKPIRPR